MKSIIKLFVLGAVVTAQVGCSKENETVENTITTSQGYDLSKTGKVDFSSKVGPDKLLSSKQLPDITVNGVVKKQRLDVIEKTVSFDNLSFDNNEDVAFPGAVLDGDAFENYELAPLNFPDSYNPVTISMNLKGNVAVSQTVEPKLSKVRDAINKMVAGQKNAIDYNFVTADINYDANEVTTNEQFALGLGLFAKVDALKKYLEVKAGLSLNVENNNYNQYVRVGFVQKMYNITVDSQHYSKWLPGGFPVMEGKKEPLYVADVTYGRRGDFFIQTKEKSTEVKLMVEAAVKSACACTGTLTGVEAELNLKFKKLMTDKKIKFIIKGGPVELAGKIQSYEDFQKFITMPNAQDLVSSSAPIIFKVRRIKDNTGVIIHQRTPTQHILVDGN